MLKRTLFAVFASAVILVAGCAKKPQSDKVDQTPKDNVQVTDVVEETPEVKEEEKEQEPEENEPEFFNSLTGLECTEQVYNNRPIAVMINNIHEAMPQIGISNADIVYEVLEEGGITRLMGVFKDYENIEELGSIRSSRDYYIDLSDAHDAIYVHCGGSTYAKDMLSRRRTNNVDGLYASQFYRSTERAKTMVYEHTLMISGKGIQEAVSSKGYRTTTQASQPLKFSDEYNMTDDANNAQNITVPFSLALLSNPYATSTFEYNKDSGLYMKGQYNTIHIDGATGNQLGFTNVITLQCNQNIIAGDPYGCLEVHFKGQGKGLYAADGVIKEIVWKKPSRTENYTLYEKDGETELVLKPGKTYIGIVPTGTRVSYN